MKKIKVGLISLGCEKNLVDSEMILGVCKEAGFEIETDLNEVDIIIINIGFQELRNSGFQEIKIHQSLLSVVC